MRTSSRENFTIIYGTEQAIFTTLSFVLSVLSQPQVCRVCDTKDLHTGEGLSELLPVVISSSSFGQAGKKKNFVR